VQMTTALSNFFRHSLSNGADVIPLGTEKQQVESYLEIQQVRYRDILDYEIDIPDTLLAYPIPKLTLQPLVENALYHGIKNKRGGGIIAIVAYDCDTRIEIVVTDNGGGMSQEQLEQLRAGVYEDRRDSFGLKNVHQRLRLYCGEQAGLVFESEEGEGTMVTVCLPK
ncbi:MAG: ATP-binding protein, partial [Eubacteriales bacterium]|nr:ATP-binding protein [Eubacteriales bacterium]